jgi:hypothetical protein
MHATTTNTIRSLIPGAHDGRVAAAQRMDGDTRSSRARNGAATVAV